ncbi:MAG: VOC family protein [Saprospiraceae bacterium]|nr:VOC family protein [Saprospiraceae bacterium]
MNINIYPCIWFENQAAEAAQFYCSNFPNSSMVSSSPMASKFTLMGFEIMGLNGGPMFKPNPSISMFSTFDSTEEVENAWNKLVVGGEVLMPLNSYPWNEKYGWLRDKYGVAWQLAKGKMHPSQSIYTTLMFTNEYNGQAEKAIAFYCSIFDDSKLNFISRYEENEGDVNDNIKHAQFELSNKLFIAFDSSQSHQFKFDEGISIVVECDTQDEIDYFWSKLTDGGQEVQCGWLKDKYGISWQIIPKVLSTYMNDDTKAQKVIGAFMKMIKFNIAELDAAANS